MNKLYHYTSIGTLYNMLEQSIFLDEETGTEYLNMRATHINCLNDETERKLFTDMLIDKVRAYSNNLNDRQIDRLKSLCNLNSYIISLSKHQDNLSMWRGYGGNGIGVNIEFNIHEITPYNKTLVPNQFKMEMVYGNSLFECKYGKIDIDSSLVQKVYEYCINPECVFNEAKIIGAINNLAPIFKHEAYREEGEWRFICNFYGSKPKYTYSNGTIKSYIEFPVPLSAITAITIGPCIKDNCIEQFIRDKLGKEVEIRYSKIPYRG